MDDLSTNAVFTLRDLNRQPAQVLEAVRKFGGAMIRTRSGEEFSLTKVEPPGKRSDQDFPDFSSRWKKLRKLGNTPPPPSLNDRINQIISGEQ